MVEEKSTSNEEASASEIFDSSASVSVRNISGNEGLKGFSSGAVFEILSLSHNASTGQAGGFVLGFSKEVDRTSLSASDFVVQALQDDHIVEGHIDRISWLDNQNLHIDYSFTGPLREGLMVGLREDMDIRSVEDAPLSLGALASEANSVGGYIMLFESGKALLPQEDSLAVFTDISDVLSDSAGTDIALSEHEDIFSLHVPHVEESENGVRHIVSLDGDGVLHLGGDMDEEMVERLAGAELKMGEDAHWRIEVDTSVGEAGFGWRVASGNDGHTTLTYSNGLDSYTIEVDTSISDGGLTLVIL